jgi:NSS family neurotransmitter:Na+ symporter
MAKERWASRVGLVLAMAGNAVGLGNFLRFPAQAASNGGGAFLIPYVIAFLIMGLPLIWVEWAMGRNGGQHGHHCAPGIFQVHGKNPIWKYVGTIGLWSCLAIAAYYLYIESWCLTYAVKSLLGGFTSMTTKAEVKEFFDRMTGAQEGSVWAISPWGMAVFGLCIVINLLILSRGLAKGIELVCKIGMPLLIGFAMLLAIRGLLIEPTDKSSPFYDPQAVASPFEGLNFVWQPRFESLSDPSVWLAAAGQIFFTLSIGMGSIHCYASYLRETDDVALTGSSAAWTNEFCEVVLGGTILIPIAVAYLGLDATRSESGFGLGFMVFPTLFNNWGALAPAAGFLWFGLLFFAAITSSLAMGQPIMALLQTDYGFKRPASAWTFGAMLLFLAIPVAIFTQKTFFDELDYWAGSFMLVVLALLEAVLFAWVFGMTRGWREITNGAEIRVPTIFRFIIKYVTPVFLAVILLGFVFKPQGRISTTDPATGESKQVDAGWSPYAQALFGGPTPPPWEWAGDGMIGKILHNDIERPGPDAPPEQKSFVQDLIWVRNLDRLAMIGAFVFLCILTGVGWRLRRGRAAT